MGGSSADIEALLVDVNDLANPTPGMLLLTLVSDSGRFQTRQTLVRRRPTARLFYFFCFVGRILE